MTETIVTKAIEIARFTLVPEHEAAFVESTDRMVALVRAHFGGLERFTRSKLEDGSYVDVVTWASTADAKRAAAGIMEVPELAQMFAGIDRMVEMLHGELAYAAVHAAA